MKDAAVRHDVVLAFEARLAGIACAGPAPESHAVVVGDRFGPYEALLETGVDHPHPLTAWDARVTR